MYDNINVIKRDGSKEPLKIEAIQRQISRACEGIDHVSPSMIELRARIQFYDNMTTKTIDNLLLQAMVNLIDVTDDLEGVNHTNYQFVAGRQRLMILRKDVYGQYNVPRLYDIVKKNVGVKLYTAELLEWYTEQEWDQIEKFVDHSRDETLSYAAVEQFVEKYLVQNRSKKILYETPQVRYAIAAATAFHAETNDRLDFVRRYYDCASKGLFTLATPVVAGLGTRTKSFSSCVLQTVGDSAKSIFATGEVMANYASARAGIGLELGRIRAAGAPVRNGEVVHTGIIPILKKWHGDLKVFQQGGIRSSSASVYLPIFHLQFPDFIVLKNNQGTEENRIRHFDYGVVMNGFFWKRFKNKENISFFDPHECSDLWDAFYSDTKKFEELYVQYEQRTDIRKVVYPAEVVIKDWILKERTDTGRIYMLFMDNVINQTPFDVKQHPVLQSNLCVTGDTPVDVEVDGVEYQNISIKKVVYEFNQGTKVCVKSKDLLTQKVEYKEITNAAQTSMNASIIEVRDEYSGKTIRCTPEHEIYTKNRGYVEAQFLEANDDLDILDQNEKTCLVVTKLETIEPVYDITVADNANFYANGILVHNCAEILLFNRPQESLSDPNGRVALCTLGSANWGKFKKPEDMREPLHMLVRSLSNVLAYSEHVSLQAKLHTEEFEPLGIGITNLAYWAAKRNLKYGTPEALAEAKRWMEHQAYYITEASIELAKEKGPCKLSHTTWYGKGVFPWERRSTNVDELTDFTPELDWEKLRKDVIQYGIRNATLSALPPVESSSVILDSTNGIELPMSLVSVKESKAGSLVQVVPEYNKLKTKYQLMWEQKDCIEYIKMAAVINAYVDQSISLNTFYSPKHFPEGKIPTTLVAKNLMLAHRWGIKSFYYSLLEKTGRKVVDEVKQDTVVETTEEVCEACVL